jgi:hypothetical protein
MTSITHHSTAHHTHPASVERARLILATCVALTIAFTLTLSLLGGGHAAGPGNGLGSSRPPASVELLGGTAR